MNTAPHTRTHAHPPTHTSPSLRNLSFLSLEQTGYWIANKILEFSEPGTRAELIAKFIYIAYDFASAFPCSSAFYSSTTVTPLPLIGSQGSLHEGGELQRSDGDPRRPEPASDPPPAENLGGLLRASRAVPIVIVSTDICAFTFVSVVVA